MAKRVAKKAGAKKSAKPGPKKRARPAPKPAGTKSASTKASAKKALRKKPAAKKSAAKAGAALSDKERWTTRSDLGAAPSTYIERLPAPARQIAQRLHDTLMSYDGVDSSIKWGMPVYTLAGEMFASIWMGKGYIRLGLVGGAGFDDPDGLLQGEGKGHRHVKIPLQGSWNEPVMMEFIRQSVAHTRAT
ncbi:MAG: DUF1801 domain-containing protein [Phycisphaeraceae bacterium]|nr:DUF1801 domain-containing protein [Phycisphaeraceae bacterium]